MSGLKSIAPVPSATDFIDVILSGTQRKTPTVIHKGFKISRIRSFYMRKVAFTRDAFNEKLETILADFPILDNLHPFLASLLNVLYDKNHYKLALGQLNTAKHLIDQVGKDYARLLKFGDSLYRCKQLKKAALGRMATIMRRQKEPLAYLEQVRQHMSRLPTIDPTTRTLLICGYPNVGKSSFLNKITKADVDVQPYAFTTKSLFVGHMDYKYLRWQVIDTPGILDHPLDEMNTIEMQSITAMAHLRSAVLYFMDLSEQCGYTVEAQCQLYHSIKPLFANKPTFLVINKTDVCRLDELDPDRRAMVEDIVKDPSVSMLQTSCFNDEGVMEVRNAACDALLAHRVEAKEKTKRVEGVANRIRVAQPVARDAVERKPFIPDAVKDRRKYDKADPERRRLERDLEEEAGGAGTYSVDLKKNYLLAVDEWKHDVMPEIVNGKNVADFVDPDILERLEELEREEERLEAEGFYDSDGAISGSDEEAINTTAAAIRRRKAQIQLAHGEKKHSQRAVIPRPDRRLKLSDMTKQLRKEGLDPARIEQRAEVIAKARKLASQTAKATGKRKADGSMDLDDAEAWEDDDGMDVDSATAAPNKRAKGAAGEAVVPHERAPGKNRQLVGMKPGQEEQARKMAMFQRRGPNRMGKASESDRHIRVKLPKHLNSGKRGRGTANHR